MESATESHLDADFELLLKGYQLYPCSWDKILVFVTEHCDRLPEDALRYYKVATKKQLKSRLSVKLGKLQQTPLSKVTNVIREELIKVLPLENRLRMPKQPANTLSSVSTDDKKENSIFDKTTSEAENTITPDKSKTTKAAEPEKMPLYNENYQTREEAVNQLSDEEQKTPMQSSAPKKRGIESGIDVGPKNKRSKSASLIDPIRQNHIEYRKFITKKMPEILKAIGISSSDSDD